MSANNPHSLHTFSGTDPPRTQNPLFKRRFSLTTTLPPFTGRTFLPTRIKTTIRSGGGITTSTDVPATTPPYFESLDNDEDTDQVAKSSIHTSLFNQINGRLHIDDEDEEDDGQTGLLASNTRLVNSVPKSVQATTTSRDPTSRFLHHQQQLQRSGNQQPLPQLHLQPQPQQQTNYNLEDVITRRMDGSVGSAGGPNALRAATKSSTTTTTTARTRLTSTTTSRPALRKRKAIFTI